MITMIRNQIKNDDVLYKLIEGKSFQTIADELGVSKTSISNRIRKIEKEIGEKKVEIILEIGTAVKKSGTNVTQILSRTRIYKILEKLNLDDDNVHVLLSEIIPKINDQTKVSELFDAAKMVLDLQESTGMTPDDIEDYCNTKRQEIVSLDEQSREANEKTEQSKNTMNNTLKENNVTTENLNDYVESRDYLEENDADVDDLPAVANMVKTSSKEKFDPKTIITEISKNHSLKQRNADQEEQNRHLLKQNQLKTKENQKLDDILEAKRPILEQVEKFEKMGITPYYLLMLFQEAIAIGEKTGIGAPEIIEKLTRDIKEQYEQKIGFENTQNRIRHEINSEQQDLEKIREEKTRVFAKVKVLRKEKIKLESSIQEYKDSAISILENMSDEQKRNYAELIQHGKISIDELVSVLKSVIADLIHDINKVHAKNMTTWDEKASEIFKIAHEFGRYEYLKALSDTSRGEGTPSKVYPSMIIMVTGFQTWLKKNNIDYWSLSNVLDSLKKQLEDRVTKNAQAA